MDRMMKRIIVIIVSLLIAANVDAWRRPWSCKTFTLHSPLKQKRYKQAYFIKCYKVKTLKKRLKKLKKKMQAIPRDEKQSEIEPQQTMEVVEQAFDPPDFEKQSVPEQDDLVVEGNEVEVAIGTDNSSSLPIGSDVSPEQNVPEIEKNKVEVVSEADDTFSLPTELARFSEQDNHEVEDSEVEVDIEMDDNSSLSTESDMLLEQDNHEKKKREKKIDSLPFSCQEADSKIQDIVLYDQQKPLQLVDQQVVQYQSPVPNYSTQYIQQPQMPVYQSQQMPMMMSQQQAPIVQQMYQQNQSQLAATAMQLQASAMAMQAQASALMMQAQQQQQPAYSHGFVMQPSTRELTKQEKMNQCVHCLKQVVNSGDDAVQRVLLLIDLEFDILEHLLSGNTGQVVDRAVQERNAIIKNSFPLVVAGYDKILDLATTYGCDDTGAHLYHYCVRKSKRANQATTSQGKKKFLMRVMYELEKYYAMLEKMQRDLAR